MQEMLAKSCLDFQRKTRSFMKEEIKRSRDCSILKLRNVVKLGHLPSRMVDEPYWARTTKTDVMFAGMANCVEHACFNFSNQQLDSIGIGTDEAENVYGGFIEPDRECSGQEMEEKLMALVRDAGLFIEKESETSVLEPNQWRIALYFEEFYPDIHVLIQEKDGSWSGKCGYNVEVETFDSLPHLWNDYYRLCGTYVITNPYAEKKTIFENEKQREI